MGIGDWEGLIVVRLAGEDFLERSGGGDGGAGVVRERGADSGRAGGVRVGFERGGSLIASLHEVFAEGGEAHFLCQVHRFTSDATPVGFVGGGARGELDAGGEFDVGGGEPGEFVAEGPTVTRGGSGEAGFREGFEELDERVTGGAEGGGVRERGPIGAGGGEGVWRISHGRGGSSRWRGLQVECGVRRSVAVAPPKRRAL